jgi:hypothetical protein
MVLASSSTCIFVRLFLIYIGPRCLGILGLMNRIVWTYSNGLELNSPRFTRPGDFFTYLVFICTIIIVSQRPLILSFSCLGARDVLRMSFCVLPPSYVFPEFDHTPRISARSVIF